MKKLNKSTWVAIAFLIYVTATGIYLLPRNNEISSDEKFLTLGGAYIVVLALWLVLRKKEQRKKHREEEINNNNNKLNK
ncbi:hypothetical protein [Bacteroides ihuae]|uniref:hypothetical protein n=1 Tax=Bacteroides ihuae TaxID=1852362 RepID=UPI0008D9AAC5|nr:hypothetical protein [Bacteroides ihuae]